MLTLDHVAMHWGDWAFHANFSVPKGTRVAVIGPSGAGKSTLISLVAGFQSPDAGQILWDGRDLTAAPPAERPVSIIFQDHNLFPHLDAAQNVGLGLRPDLRLDRAQWAQVESALARVGLEGMARRKPGQLSGGQAARVPLARVLLRHKPLVLLDEPFGALGPALRAEMLALVDELVDEIGATLLFVSHEPEDARSIADMVVFVENGTALPPQPTERIFTDPPDAMRAYLGR